MGLKDLDAIAVTQGPGLVGSLLVGLSFAKSLAASTGLPLVPVHHLAGHIESLFLHNGPLPLPAVVLVVSGGHTSLYLVPEPGVYRLLARTRDDAAGEAYDKVAKLLGLGYPGGPIIDKLAREGNDRAIDFPIARITHRDRNAPQEPGRLDFSFSGIKTAVSRYVKAHSVDAGQWAVSGKDQRTAGQPTAGSGRHARRVGWHWEQSHRSIAASHDHGQPLSLTFARAFSGRSSRHCWTVCSRRRRRHGAKSVGIAGGVSANSRLRKDAQERGEKFGLPVYLPTLALSTDNAAMIAAAGLRRFHEGVQGRGRPERGREPRALTRQRRTQ